jgi:AraC-like DNA-binding protein
LAHHARPWWNASRAISPNRRWAYLIRWRLQLAARALGSTSRGVADIAEEVGYESEAAFNRAFKREFGSHPRVTAESKERREYQ